MSLFTRFLAWRARRRKAKHNAWKRKNRVVFPYRPPSGLPLPHPSTTRTVSLEAAGKVRER
jgi:hypothetical protein